MKLTLLAPLLLLSQNAAASALPPSDLGYRNIVVEEYIRRDLSLPLEKYSLDLTERDLARFKVILGAGARAIGNVVVTGGTLVAGAVVVNLTNKIAEPITVEIWKAGEKIGSWVLQASTCAYKATLGNKVRQGDEVEFLVPT